MGIRVYFSYGSKNGAMDHLLSAPLDVFRSWYASEFHSPDEALVSVDAQQLSLLDDIIERGAEAFAATTHEQARRLDLLVSDFYFWCDWEQPELLVEASGTTNVYRYRDAEPEILKLFGEEAARLWHYLLNGRPVGRSEVSAPYVPREVGYPKSYWTFDEVSLLYHCMLPHIRNLTQADEATFWDALETTFEAVKNAFEVEKGLIIEVA